MRTKKRKNAAEPDEGSAATVSPQTPAFSAKKSRHAVDRSDQDSSRMERDHAALESSDQAAKIPLAVEDFADDDGVKLFLVQIPPGLDVGRLAGQSIPVGRRAGQCRRRRVTLETREGEDVRETAALDVSVCQVPPLTTEGEDGSGQSTGSQLADYLKKWTVALPSRSQPGYTMLPRRLDGLVTISRSIALPPVSLDVTP
ncbi:uncharacterized protein LOC129582183 isoform X2 [Paramacrobiotus metropolitanus]|uniref:uncharacterized protein LOC129582183 isoform X2 n=1 Tax=Paramacrobiotus metropolitanus TaxID=2943436 RepID=UPI002445EA22|nr:uncharacterized protein LOC129582183 isoform X2 [Paramacrobiotus metropolitanus]